MKKLALLIVGLLILNIGFSQKQEVKLKNSIVYQLEAKNDSLVLLPSEINLEVAEWEFDSCNFYNNSFEFQFEIKNTTKKPIMCNKALDCWNDSGLTNYGTFKGEPVTIAPGKTEKITVRVMPYSKRKMSPSTEFIIMQESSSILVPLKLKFACTSMKPCEKIKPVYSPEN